MTGPAKGAATDNSNPLVMFEILAGGPLPAGDDLLRGHAMDTGSDVNVISIFDPSED